MNAGKYRIPIDPIGLEFRMKDQYVGAKYNTPQFTRLKSG